MFSLNKKNNKVIETAADEFVNILISLIENDKAKKKKNVDNFSKETINKLKKDD